MKATILALTLLIGYQGRAQTIQEWTQQKKTQIEYLIKQIAGLKTYAGAVQKGYAIAQKGLHTIRSIQNGDFKLHEAYLETLDKVNPKIRSYWKVSAMLTLQIDMVQTCQKQKRVFQDSKQFTADELRYYSTVFTTLSDACKDVIDAAMLVTTNGALALKDEERIKRLDALYTEVLNQYAFMSAFNQETAVLALQRARENGEIKTMRAYMGIK